MPKLRTIAGLAVLAAVIGGTAAPAQAGFFDRLFGSITRHIQPPAELPGLPQLSPIPGDRVAPQGGENWRTSGNGGPRTAFCVRTCDGHYFPVQANAEYSAAQMCSAFCPASETKLYSGSGIDHAVGLDGRPYTELPNAYAYRKQVVANCTCNGKDIFGVARLAVNGDPTLRRGDVIATQNGTMTAAGKTGNGVQFTSSGRRFPPTTDGRAPPDR
jgi:hypothetical protein